MFKDFPSMQNVAKFAKNAFDLADSLNTEAMGFNTGC